MLLIQISDPTLLEESGSCTQYVASTRTHTLLSFYETFRDTTRISYDFIQVLELNI